MTIEVRQLVIKSTVQGSSGAQARQVLDETKLEELKQSILDECQRLVANMIAESRER